MTDLNRDVTTAFRLVLADPAESAATKRAVRAALGRLSADARARGLSPEQLLVLLKETWARMPESRSAQHHPYRDELLSSVVTLCIKEYFTDAGDHQDGG